MLIRPFKDKTTWIRENGAWNLCWLTLTKKLYTQPTHFLLFGLRMFITSYILNSNTILIRPTYKGLYIYMQGHHLGLPISFKHLYFSFVVAKLMLTFDKFLISFHRNANKWWMKKKRKNRGSNESKRPVILNPPLHLVKIVKTCLL